MGRWVAALLLAVAGSPASAAEKVEVGLEVAGRSDLGGPGPFDDVTVVGTTAVVAAGECPGGSLAVVDVKDPRRPSVVATVPLRPSTVAVDLDAQPLATESFTGDLLAVALTPCTAAASPGVAYYDLTVPAHPRLLAERQGPGAGSVAIAQREDGAVAVRPAGPTSVAVDDISDPARPVEAGRWTAAGPALAGTCVPLEAQVAGLFDDGRRALVLLSDGRVYDLDLAVPSRPADGGMGGSTARSRYGAVLPVGARTLAIVAGERGDGPCPTGPVPRLRVLELTAGTPSEVEPVQFTTAAAPGRLVASGELAYVAWHGDGLRVVDLGAVKPVVTAQFIPAGPERPLERGAGPAVVAVALLDEHVVAVDRSSGLYLLERPDEGGPASTWWTNVVGLLPYLLFAALLTALLVLPRLALSRARARSAVPSPAPEGVRRRTT